MTFTQDIQQRVRGGAEWLQVSAPSTREIHFLRARLTRCQIDTGGTLTLVLPDARRAHIGSLLFAIANMAVSIAAVTIEDHENSTVATIAAGEFAEIGCTDNSTEAGVWTFDILTLDGHS